MHDTGNSITQDDIDANIYDYLDDCKAEYLDAFSMSGRPLPPVPSNTVAEIESEDRELPAYSKVCKLNDKRYLRNLGRTQEEKYISNFLYE